MKVQFAELKKIEISRWRTMGTLDMTNEKRAEELIQRFGFEFRTIPKGEIRNLIEQEIEHFQEGSSEYIRLLCGYLFCVGDRSDVTLLEKAKYGINFDVGCMIDQEWIDSLKNGGVEDEYVSSRETIIEKFIAYYGEFEADEEDDVWRGQTFQFSFFDE